MDEESEMVEHTAEARAEVTGKRRDSITIAAIWAVAFVLLACIAACTLVTIIFINNAPW